MRLTFVVKYFGPEAHKLTADEDVIYRIIPDKRLCFFKCFFIETWSSTLKEELRMEVRITGIQAFICLL
jgi:isochorismate hydrolase